MLLQRLILDEALGFNYDNMDLPEFDAVSTRNGRSGVAKAFHEKRLIAKQMLLREEGHGEVMPRLPVIVLAPKGDRVFESDQLTISGRRVPLKTTNRNIVGWMHVGSSVREERPFSEPLLIVRADCDDMINRINQFFEDVIAEQAA